MAADDRTLPKRSKALTFGELLSWHLMQGTRPRGSVVQGQAWAKKAFADDIGIGDRQLRYWLQNEKLPAEMVTVERVLFGNDQEYARERRLELREAFRRSKFGSIASETAIGIIAAPERRLPISNIPILLPEHFLGRDEALEAVDRALKRREGRVAITAVHGLRGVGKTTLVAAYAQQHSAEYSATWWIHAHTPGGMRADLVALGVRLGWVQPDDKEVLAFETVAERLRHEGEGLLLIYDNAIEADALRPWLPKGGAARVLVTSNAHAWRGLAEPLELNVWPKSIGGDYFADRLGRDGERADGEALSETLGGLPLAHEQAAAYCERLGVSLADYRHRFEAHPIKLLNGEKDAPAEYYNRLTVAKTFALAIEEAGKLHPAAELLIVHAAMLAPQPIPFFLFEDGREALGEPFAAVLADDGLEEAISALRAFALADLETVADERDASIETKCFRLHRLVRAVAGARCEGKAREATRSGLAAAMAGAMRASGDEWDARSWPRLRRLTEAAEALIGPNLAGGENDTRIAYLCNQLATLSSAGHADYVRARPLYQRALAIREKVLGLDHPETATTLHGLGILEKGQGDLSGARPLFERALAIRERALGFDHAETAKIANDLGLLFQAHGDLASARPLYERAIAAFENVLGQEHRSTAISLDNLGCLLHQQGDLAGALPIFERALAIKEKSLGPDHPDTGSSLNNLATLLQHQGDVERAGPLYERALAIMEKTFGPNHPKTAISLDNLASLKKDQGDFAGALPLYERALTICEKSLGLAHSETAMSLHSLGQLQQALGNLAGAQLLYERALAIFEKSLGPEHPETATTLNRLGSLKQDQGDFAGALPLFRRALSIYEKSIGPKSPRSAICTNNLAHALVGLGNFADAEPLFRRAITSGEAALGGEHQITHRFRSNFARLLAHTARAAEALPLAEAALAAHARVNGTEHPWTKDSARAVAEALGELGRTDEATAVRLKHRL